MTRECQQIRDLMDSYLSGELLVESNHLVLRHLETCDECRAEAERRQQTRTLLRQSLNAPIDAGMLRARVVKALDAEQGRWPMAARYAAVAAAVIVGIAVTLWASRPVDAAAYADSADNHVQCALTIPASAVYDPARVAKRLEAPYLGIVDAVPHRVGGYDLIDAHMCPYPGRKYVHLIYKGEGRVVSVFAEQALRGALPRSGAARLDAVPIDAFATHQNGYWVAGTSTRRHHVFVVSSDQTSAPTREAGDLLHATTGFLRAVER